MPADYEQIRDENVARYGWDTAVLDLLGHLYSERTHFIFELIQNAEDAGATVLDFALFGDRLEVRHDGRPFTEADVRGVTGVAQSGKSGDLTKIGQFGIGFKSVYAYTRTPRIYSGAEHFRIDHYVRPSAVDPVDPADENSPETLFVFPFDHDTVTASTAAGEISAALNRIEPATLLFLRNITRLRAHGTGVTGAVIERRTQPRAPASPALAGRSITLTRSQDDSVRAQDWFVWERPLDDVGHAGQRVELAFRAGTAHREPRLTGLDSSPLVVFFPTQKETFLGFLVQGPYRTTPARDNVPGDDPANQVLIRATATLLVDVLRELRASGLLTVEVLVALPLDATRFAPGSMLRPLFDAVRTALTEEELIPAAGGGYAAARNLKLATPGELRELLAPGQLAALFQTDLPLAFADLFRNEDHAPLLRRYLREEIGVGEVTPGDLLARATGSFLEAQPDEWITRFYGFLHAEPDLWREPRVPGEPAGPARTRPIIRLEDGRQAEPFDAAGRPAAYLPADYEPGPAGTGFPTVRRAVADVPAARAFLEALKFTEPDIVAEVLEVILPRYARLAGDGEGGPRGSGAPAGGPSGVAALDRAQHAADLDCIMRAMDEADAGRRARLLEQLRETAFLIGENAATGEQRLMPPPALYQRTRDLEIYLDGNTGAWFAEDAYGPWLVQLRGMGVRGQVDVQARAPGPLGHVLIVAGFARHERGVDGFDPDARIDGLEFALQHPGHARAEYVWNVLLAPNWRLVGGVVEKSVREQFADSTRETVRSSIGVAAAGEAWLPGPDGLFHRPADLSLDDLPPTFARDEGLAQALGMSQPVVSQAARRLGIPPEVLWGLSAHPDLVATIEDELKTRSAGRNPLGPPSGADPAGDQ
ncbi:MAG: sacsin N-terminal ATP-binding-like domain-containing protein [Streptosporangiaceae bacterium]